MVLTNHGFVFEGGHRRRSFRFRRPAVEKAIVRGGDDQRWRVIAAWAVWQRASLLDHIGDAEKNTLREVLLRTSREIESEGVLDARLEVAEVMLSVKADGAAVCAALEAQSLQQVSRVDSTAIVASDVATLTGEIRELRRGLSTPIASEARTEKDSSSWANIDDAASSVRRAVAFATRDARALLAELASVVVALRRGSQRDDATARLLALQAVLVHLPLAELLKIAEDRRALSYESNELTLFSATRYAELLKEIEDRAYSTLFTETYSLLRWKASRARLVLGDVEVFAAAARTAIAREMAHDALAISSCIGDAAAVSSPHGSVPDVLVARLEEVLVVTARVKTPASALRKMLRRKESTTSKNAVPSVRDLVGLRVVVHTPPFLDAKEDDAAAVYSIYRAVRRIWPELEGRFKDYVARPKKSGYQSLHTTVWLEECPMEVQMRTARMDSVAESGRASHALYSGMRRDSILAAELTEAPLNTRRLLPPPEESTSLQKPAPVEGEEDVMFR